MSEKLWKVLEGQVINNTYHLRGVLGSGAFGGVFLAEEVVADRLIRQVAIKLIPPDEKCIDSQVQELVAATTLHHPHLLRCHAPGQCELRGVPFLYLVMELAQGTLKDRLAQGVLSVEETLVLAKQLASALIYLHEQNRVHRDLKPSNVMRVGGVWKVADFGLIRAVGESGVDRTQTVKGTFAYMPPEGFQFQVSPAWDMWSLGVVLLEGLTGRRPYHTVTEASLPRAILEQEAVIPAELTEPCGAIVRGCLRKNVENRLTAAVVEAMTRWPIGVGWRIAAFGANGWRISMQSCSQYVGVPTATDHFAMFSVSFDHTIRYELRVRGSDRREESILPGAAKQIAVAKNADGRLEIFYIGMDDSIWHNWQVKPNEGWQGEQQLGGRAKQIAVGNNADGRLEIFYIGMDDSIWHNWQVEPNGGWQGEQQLGGRAKQIAVANNADGRLEIFYIGMDDSIWHNWQVEPNSIWQGEQTLGGRARDLAVCQGPGRRLEIYYTGMDDWPRRNWQIEPNGVWHGEAED